MEIYVQSCGSLRAQEYRWYKVEEDGQHRKNPSILVEGGLTNLFRSNQARDFSVLLARDKDSLALLVNGLEAKERTDCLGGKAYNSVLWVGQESDEPKLRRLTIRALKDSLNLANDIDKAIEFRDDESGFQARFEDIQKLASSNEVDSNSTSRNASLNRNRKRGRNSEKLRQELAKELEEITLPRGNGLLLVVTGIATINDVQKVKVWRCLAEFIDGSESEMDWVIGGDWQQIPEQKEEEKKKPDEEISLSDSSTKFSDASEFNSGEEIKILRQEGERDRQVEKILEKVGKDVRKTRKFAKELSQMFVSFISNFRSNNDKEEDN